MIASQEPTIGDKMLVCVVWDIKRYDYISLFFFLQSSKYKLEPPEIAEVPVKRVPLRDVHNI